MHTRAIVLILAAILPPSNSLSERSVPFDYAWRFQMASANRTDCPDFAPGFMTCGGLRDEPSAAGSAQACRDACCKAQDCFVWQFKVNGTAPAGSRCWMGQCKSVPKPTDGWVSGIASIPELPSGCAKDTNDSSWEFVDLPHDYLVTLPVDEKENGSGGYFPRKNATYRKHFVLPEAWHGDRILLHFEGVYKIGHVFINGKSTTYAHADSSHAYTGFDVRLDTENISYGLSQPNVIAIYVDGSYGSEHWYAGAGIYRSVHLIHTAMTHLDPQSVYTPAAINFPGTVGLSATTADATVKPVLQVVNEAQTTADIVVTVRVLDYNGITVVGNSSSALVLAAGAEQTVHTADIVIKSATLWSTQAPHLYRTQSILTNSLGKVLDEVNSTFGIRSTTWDADRGFFLNGASVKIRGFCHHDDVSGYSKPCSTTCLCHS
jgi:hypothetical protein